MKLRTALIITFGYLALLFVLDVCREHERQECDAAGGIPILMNGAWACIKGGVR